MARKKARTGWIKYLPRLLLVIPFLVVAWVPFYNRVEPDLGGIPFFHWYQLLWILLGAALVLIVYVIDTRITGLTPKTQDKLDTTGAPGDIL